MVDIKNRLNPFLAAIIICISVMEPAAAEKSDMVGYSSGFYPAVSVLGILFLCPLALFCKWFFVKKVMERSWRQSLLPLCLTQFSHFTIGLMISFFAILFLADVWFKITGIWFEYAGVDVQTGWNRYAWTYWFLFWPLLTGMIALVELMTLRVFYWKSFKMCFKKFALLCVGQAIYSSLFYLSLDIKFLENLTLNAIFGGR